MGQAEGQAGLTWDCESLQRLRLLFCCTEGPEVAAVLLTSEPVRTRRSVGI